MLTVRQVINRGWLLLGLLVIVGCVPAQTGNGGTPIPTAIVAETAVVTTAATTPTENTPTATATPLPADTSTPTPQTATATPIVVLATDVPYVIALTDLNLHNGPGLGYTVVGWLSSGQIAEVTGVSTDGGWWQLACPSDAATHCWVSAGSQYTEPQPDATRFQFAPGATSGTITGSVEGPADIRYLLRAEAGQTMVVKVTDPAGGVLFHLQGMSDGQIYKHLLDGESSWQGVLPQTQDYLLALNVSGGTTTYSVYVSITDQPPTAEPPTPTPTPTGVAIPGGPLYPVVDAESGYLLGGTQNGQWIDAQTYAVHLQDTERPYNIYTMAGYQGRITGSPPVAPGGVCSQPLVTFHPSHDLAGAIALVARWEAAPRLAQSLPTNTAVYREAVAALLQEQGLAEPEVQIDSIQRIDLEGDGVDEVLIAASRLAAGTSAPPVAAGDYSLVALRQVAGDAAVTIPLALDVYAEANELAYPFQYRILGLLDLNGDGRLEIVMAADRYEGQRLTVYEVTSSGVQPVLQAGCVQ